MPGFDLPAGWEIAATLAGGIAALLGAIAYFIRRRADDPPHDRALAVDLTPVITRIDQQDRAFSQLVHSQHESLLRALRELEAENRRGQDRIIDRLDRD